MKRVFRTRDGSRAIRLYRDASTFDWYSYACPLARVIAARAAEVAECDRAAVAVDAWENFGPLRTKGARYLARLVDANGNQCGEAGMGNTLAHAVSDILYRLPPQDYTETV
jgi:hypothetical protein